MANITVMLTILLDKRDLRLAIIFIKRRKTAKRKQENCTVQQRICLHRTDRGRVIVKSGLPEQIPLPCGVHFVQVSRCRSLTWHQPFGDQKLALTTPCLSSLARLLLIEGPVCLWLLQLLAHLERHLKYRISGLCWDQGKRMLPSACKLGENILLNIEQFSLLVCYAVVVVIIIVGICSQFKVI